MVLEEKSPLSAEGVIGSKARQGRVAALHHREFHRALWFNAKHPHGAISFGSLVGNQPRPSAAADAA